MMLRKITFDNSVKDFPQNVQIQERDNKPNTLRDYSLRRKQNEIFAQNKNKFIKKHSGRRTENP